VQRPKLGADRVKDLPLVFQKAVDRRRNRIGEGIAERFGRLGL
jgi:hypothetical protein